MSRVRSTSLAREVVPGHLLLLEAVLAGHTATPGGLCVGRSPWWDDEVEGGRMRERAARLDAARRLCERCPERPGCPDPVR